MKILLAAVLLAMPVEAAEPLPERDVYCSEKWCAIKRETLKALIENTQKLMDDSKQLRLLCGWDK